MQRKLTTCFLFLFLGAFSLSLQAQDKKNEQVLEGIITDSATGKPLEGVTILVNGVAGRVLTDSKGHFSKRIPAFPVIVNASIVGYKAAGVSVSASPASIVLSGDIAGLSDVVVVGYGKQAKSDVTGSIAHINGDVIKDVPVQSFDQALSGKAAGVSISLPNGVLNNPPVIRIRGINSISLSSYPLIVVDGIPLNTGNVSTNTNVVNNPLGDINPQDIQSIDILKDAASTAIYGSRAAAGVMVITTKRGKKGQAVTNFNGWVGVTNATRQPKVLNAQQYMTIKNEAVYNAKDLAGNAASYTPLFLPSYNADSSVVDTKWDDYVYKTALSKNFNIDVSGATEKTNYFLSANVSDQDGFLVGNNFKREAIRFNIDHAVTPWLKLKAGGNYNHTFNKSYNTGSLPNTAQLLIGAARLATALPPNVAAYNPDGSFNLSSSGAIGMGNNNATLTLYNPLALFQYSRYTSETDHFIGNVGATVRFLKHFEFNSLYSVDRSKIENQTWLSSDIGSSAYSTGGGATNVSTSINNWDWTNNVNFTYNWHDHNISVLAGVDEQQIKNNAWGAAASVASDNYFQYYQGGWTNVAASGNSMGTSAFISSFGRVNYDFARKYFVSANFRRDGNSALAAGNKYGNFGGFSLGWQLSKEDFYQKLKLSRILTGVKLKGSWGRVGNGNLSSNYAAMSLYSASLYGTASTWNLSQVGNANLKWETSLQTNVGAELSVLNNLAQVEVTYFNNNVNGLILNSPQAPSRGIPNSSILQNVGSMYNRGIEVGINAQVIQKKKFGWNVAVNYTHIVNKVTELANGNADVVGYTHTTANSNNVTRVGYSISSLYGAKTAGVNPDNGRRIFINAKGEKVQYSSVVASGQSNWTYLDGTTAAAISSSDYYLLANALPKWYGGISNSFTYGSLDLNLNFTYSGGNYVMNGSKGTLREQSAYNNATEVLNRWTTKGQVTDVPRVVYGDLISNGSSFPVSANVEKADFLRLQNVALGYRFNGQFLKGAKITSLRLYAQVTNAFIITKYTGTDPESSSNGNSNTSIGVERNSVGLGRTFTFGFNASF
ncbi:SusC/RagA family TonB-linked outer membrane protein [Filimonas lacunae]|uniref:SusC/RagA family TonB-linked outer membrane protein n=1 Tax=Filimonas lacunae TaxID=477680 RepID=UPI000970D0D8|nr:SusC/RagA family TonB-linked outer membrane protein [Filimonas lacunae]